MIRIVGFDGDDTLWRSQEFYDQAQLDFEAIIARYIDLDSAGLRATLLATERGNLAQYGYGVKGMILSMVEAAIDLTGGRIEAKDIRTIMDMGKDLLVHPVELLPGIAEAVEQVAVGLQLDAVPGGMFQRSVREAGSEVLVPVDQHCALDPGPLAQAHLQLVRHDGRLQAVLQLRDLGG